jgi:hypothetical protein
MDEQLFLRSLLRKKNRKYKHGGRLKFKINILFYRDNSWTVAFRQIKFCTLKDHGRAYMFYLNHYFLWRSFWIWRWFVILRLCWDQLWTTLCKVLQLCGMSYFCKLFISLLNVMFSFGMVMAWFWSPNLFIFIKDALNIRDTNMASEEYSRLYLSVFIFGIYNMG